MSSLIDFCREFQLSHGGSKQSACPHRQHNMEAKTRSDRRTDVMLFSASETMSAADFASFSSVPCESLLHTGVAPALYCAELWCWEGAVRSSALSLTRLVLVMRWQACKQSDWFSQQTSEASFSFWLIFHKLTLAASQRWCKGRLCCWLFVIYHTLAGWVYSVSVMENRPKSAEHLFESEIKHLNILMIFFCVLLALKCNPQSDSLYTFVLNISKINVHYYYIMYSVITVSALHNMRCLCVSCAQQMASPADTTLRWAACRCLSQSKGRGQ